MNIMIIGHDLEAFGIPHQKLGLLSNFRSKQAQKF
jgi:hypothetical protein